MLIFCSSVVSIYGDGLPMPLFISCREGFFSETALPVLCISVLGGLAFEEIDDDPAGFVSYTRLVVRL